MGRGVPELVLEFNGRTWTLDPSRPYTLGRDPQGDLTADDARVSWRHATISWNGRSWSIEDHGSTNGTYVQGRRIQQTEIGPGAAVNLGNANDGPRLNFTAAAGAGVSGGQQPVAQPGPAQPQQGAPAWPDPAHGQHPRQAAAQQQVHYAPPVPHQQGPTPGAGGPGAGGGGA
ncbi:FHA domain-containing protein, partial [Streptomyces sp. NRRL WC-3549]|uniref:FHA domain-containing protein n=1 Tax=Streptomyces sp. NRRL WC-3549 TaxID=1463925 RepID=UPI00131D64CC